jgi:hypothetical protein
MDRIHHLKERSVDTSLEFWHHHGGVNVPDLDVSIQKAKPTEDCAKLSDA